MWRFGERTEKITVAAIATTIKKEEGDIGRDKRELWRSR